MTDTLTQDAETITDAVVSAPPPRNARLAAAARNARGRKTAPRKATARKAPANASRNAKAAARGKYANQIVPGAKLVGSMAFRDPVQQEIVGAIVEDWAASLDRLAAQDTRVDAVLSKIAGVAGSGGAWGDFAIHTAVGISAMTLAAGRTPGGPAGAVMVVLGGQLVTAATAAAAERLATEEAAAAGQDAADPWRVQQIHGELLATRDAKREERAAKRKKAKPADVPDEDQADTPDPAPIGQPFAAWNG